MKSGFTSDGYLHVITFMHIPSKWVPTTNESLAKGRSCLLPKCRPQDGKWWLWEIMSDGFFLGDEWFFVGNPSEKTWEWIVLMGFFLMDFRITRNLTSDGFSRWIAGFSDYRFLLSKKLQPRSMLAAHLQNKVHPLILPNSEIHWLCCLPIKKSGPCHVFPNRCPQQAVIASFTARMASGSIWIVVSWGFDLHPVVWLVNPQQCTSRI